MTQTKRTFYQVVDGKQTRSWISYVEYPRQGESCASFTARIHEYYAMFPLFTVELVERPEGHPAHIVVRVLDKEYGP